MKSQHKETLTQTPLLCLQLKTGGKTSTNPNVLNFFGAKKSPLLTTNIAGQKIEKSPGHKNWRNQMNQLYREIFFLLQIFSMEIRILLSESVN